MEISEPRKAALFKAISDPIMKRRISVAMSQEVLGTANTKQLDELFYKLERDIWNQVKAALDISESTKVERSEPKKSRP